MTEQSVEVAVEVPVAPPAAFKIFTEEIDLWWVRGPINFWDSARAIEVRIEPGVGGRILEVYADDALERGVITAWEPGERLEYRSSVDDTETTITFAPIDGGTRVIVRHEGFGDAQAACQNHAEGWERVLGWLSDNYRTAA